MIKNNIWIFAFQECLAAFNIGSLSFFEGLKSQIGVPQQFRKKFFNVLLKVSLFQKNVFRILK